MTRMHFAPGAFRLTEHHRPTSFGFVVSAAFKLRAGPEVEFHGLDVGFEPVGELVFGNVDRPVRRERHIGQVVDLHLIVQGQRVIALAPVVTDARLAIDNEGIDLQLLETRGDANTGLPSAYDRTAGSRSSYRAAAF